MSWTNRSSISRGPLPSERPSEDIHAQVAAFAGALVAALLVASAGAATAQSPQGLSSDGVDAASVSSAPEADGGFVGGAG